MHLSAGDLLRAERNSGSKNAELINEIILKGEIVPVEITVNLIKDAMKAAGWSTKKFLIDGFPRNAENQEGWVKVMGSDVNMEFVLFLDAKEEQMVERIMGRAKADVAAGKEARNDDNEETLRKRFTTFTEQSVPIVELYKKTDQVRVIDAQGDKDQVYN